MKEYRVFCKKRFRTIHAYSAEQAARWFVELDYWDCKEEWQDQTPQQINVFHEQEKTVIFTITLDRDPVFYLTVVAVEQEFYFAAPGEDVCMLQASDVHTAFQKYMDIWLSAKPRQPGMYQIRVEDSLKNVHQIVISYQEKKEEVHLPVQPFSCDVDGKVEIIYAKDKRTAAEYFARGQTLSVYVRNMQKSAGGYVQVNNGRACY